MNVYIQISKLKILFATFFTSDFNTHSVCRDISTYLDATNFEPHKNPSCVDLVVTDQPNIIFHSGTRDSLDSYCHHQLIVKLISKYLLFYTLRQKIGILTEQTRLLLKSMVSFTWRQHLNINTNPNWQIKIFTDTVLNIMSNVIANETKRFTLHDPLWKPNRRQCDLYLFPAAHNSAKSNETRKFRKKLVNAFRVCPWKEACSHRAKRNTRLFTNGPDFPGSFEGSMEVIHRILDVFKDSQ